MSLNLSNIRAPKGASHGKKRVGRGIGSGHGKTSTRGQKGAKARGTIRPGFEGGQTPLHRRLPKRRGLSRTSMPIGMHRKEYAVINVETLERFDAGTEVTPALLKEHGIVRKLGAGLRVLGEGSLSKALKVSAHHFSKTAQEKITSAGGTAQFLS